MSEPRPDTARARSPERRPAVAPALPPLSTLDRLSLAREVLFTYVGVRRRMRHLGLRETVAALRAGDSRGGPVEPDLESRCLGIRLGRATSRTLTLLPADSRCLMQSLVLLGMLSRRGIEAELVIGVRSKPEFAAHAWVVHGGTPLLPSGEFGRLVGL